MSNKHNKSGKVSKEQLQEAVAQQKPKISKAEKAAVDHVAQRITKEKDLKYIYPEDCTTLAGRKKFRTSCRGKLKTLLKNVRLAEKGKLDGVTLEAAQKELNAFKKANYAKPE